MDIEKIRVNVTLQAGKQVWVAGEVVNKPIPAPLMTDIREGAVDQHGHPTITILERSRIVEPDEEEEEEDVVPEFVEPVAKAVKKKPGPRARKKK